MNSKTFFIILFVLGGLVVFGLTTRSNKSKPNYTPSSQVQGRATTTQESIPTLQPQTKSMGAVEVEITPTQIQSGENLIFKISLNTHSVELDYDFTQISSLIDDQGNTFKATTWDGELGGHHLEGNLVFAPITTNPSELSLTVDGVDSATETFVWQL